MSNQPSLGSEQAHRLDAVLAEYLEAVAAGSAPARADVLARHPDLAAELNEFFGNHDQMAQLAGPATAAGPSASADAPPQGPAEDRLGDYEILNEIARGGMGVVYRVRQASLNREVALKMMLPGKAASAEMLRRFRVEAEAAAHLDHPNIVPIYEVGEMAGRPYFTMKLVEGGSLASRLEEFRLADPGRTPRPGRRALRHQGECLADLLATVARAIHHAHQRGILHRDLKPANILLDGDGRPLVSDFGLAKRVEQDAGLTQPHTVLGTASYMPPEQAQPHKVVLTTAADVYALGAILYELLTGRPPFVGESYFNTLWRVVQEPLVPPRRRNPYVPAELEAVCLKALEKDPAARYGSARELAEDLERCRAGEAVSVRRQTPAERVRRWARRNPLTATLLAAVALLLLVVCAGSLVAAWRIAGARDRADANARLANASAREAARLAEEEHTARALAEGAQVRTHGLLVSGYIANGTRALDGGDLFGSLVWYGEALRLDRGDPDREDAHRVRLAAVLRRCPRLVQVWFDNGGGPAALSSDGRRVLRIHRDVARTWDVAGGQAVSPPMKHAADVKRALFSPDGRRVATLAADGTVRVWDATSGQPVTPPLRHEKAITWAAFNPDGGRLATVGADRLAQIWDAATGLRLVGPLRHDLPLRFATFSRDGKRLVTCGGDPGTRRGEVRVWDLTVKPPSSRSLSLSLVVHWAHLTPDGEHVIGVGRRRTAHVWALAGGGTDSHRVTGVRLDPDGAVGPDPSRVLRLEGSTAQVYDLTQDKPLGPPLLHGGDVILAAFSPDGQRVATAARDRTVRVWDVAKGKPLTPPLRHGHAVHHAAFSADGRRLLTTTEDSVVRAWDLASREVVQPLPPRRDAGPTAPSPDGQLIAAVDRSGAVWVRDAVSDHVRRGPWKLAHPVTTVVFSPDGQRVLGASDSGLGIWDVASGEAVTPVLPQTGAVQQLLFSPDGSRAATLDAEGMLRVYAVPSGAAQSSHPMSVRGPAFGIVITPDGRAVVAFRRSELDTVALVDVVSGVIRRGPFRHPTRVTAVAVSPDGTRLAVATADGSAFLWGVASARPAAPPLQHGAPLRRVAFSADGRRLLTVAEDQTVRVWDVVSGQPVTPLWALEQPVTGASLAADGRRLVVRARDGSGTVWDLSPDARPVEDLVRLTQLLSGQAVDGSSGGLRPIELAGPRATWPALRVRFPQESTPAAP